MPVEFISLDGLWKLKEKERSNKLPDKLSDAKLAGTGWLNADVPGDVHATLIKEGVIKDPYIYMNSKECSWVGQRDWWFQKSIMVPKGFKGKRVELSFDGIDMFSTVYVNDKKIAETENAFLGYSFDVSEYLDYGNTNLITVCIRATKPILELKKTDDYFACFYTPRVFARKAQCQFGWDWAPDLCAVGIWQSVKLAAYTQGVIKDVYIRTKIKGEAHFEVELDGETKESVKKGHTHSLRIEILKNNQKYSKDINVAGKKNFANIDIPNPQLWWPNGYGEAELYDYEISLSREGLVLDKKKGRFGIRQVEVVESGSPDGTNSFKFKLNGREVFCMGANWVPSDCFPGVVKKERYERLIKLVKEGNQNTLRIWGGGIYEKDEFYELCDENGIMIWQDLMFACADIPDDDIEWTMKLAGEFEYQVKRIRNHPCIIHWCGGNEKTGSLNEMKSHGDFVTDYLGRGVVTHFMPGASYASSSPHSITAISNDSTSGDSHGCTWEASFEDNIRNFRHHIEQKQVVFMSEFGFHGPPRLETVRRFISKEKLWPINEMWEHHIMDNPYNSLEETYVQVELASVRELFGEPRNAAEFVKFAGTLSAEYLSAEFQHHRRRQGVNGGSLIWMYNDCWPAASWALVDYYGLPKQSYYAIKRNCEPVRLSFRERADKYELYLTHNLYKKVAGTVSVYAMDVLGRKEHILSKEVSVEAHSSNIAANILNSDIPAFDGSYMVAYFESEDMKIREIFFPKLWRDIPWPDPELKYSLVETKRCDDYNVGKIEITAQKYARCVYLLLDNENESFISDNYFDLLPEERKIISVKTKSILKKENISVKHWLDEWNR
ncbi:MAG: sugar-binding domain-containing protein [Phycisphaerae bacterium]|jgi:beta-mannosidase